MKEYLNRANKIFQERNFGFRVLYDTILRVNELSEDSEIIPCILHNFIRMTNGKSACFAHIDKRSKSGYVKVYASDENNVAFYDKHHRLAFKVEHQLLSLLDEQSVLDHFSLSRERISELNIPLLSEMFGKEDMIHGYIFLKDQTSCDIGIVAVDGELRIKDLVETYVNMSSIIINKLMSDTKMRQSQQRFSVLFENAPIGIMLVDGKKNIININKKLTEMLGKTKSAFIGKKCYESYCNNENKSCELLTDDIHFYEQENRIKTSLMNDLPVLQSVREIRFGDEKLILETVVDLGEVKKMEAEKEILLKSLYQTQKLESLKTLAAGVAHEVNTPLQSLLNNTNFLSRTIKKYSEVNEEIFKIIEKNVPESQQKSCMDEIDDLIKHKKIYQSRDMVEDIFMEMDEAIKSVKDVVGYIKDFTIVEQANRSIIDVNQIVKGLMNIYRHELSKNLDIRMDLSYNLPKIYGERTRIKEVLIELINNSVEAIEAVNKEERGLINIETYQKNDEVVISIRDNGCGISEEYEEKVFDLFFTTKDIGKGTGQGLSYAYNIVVNEHQGRLTYSSDVNKGTTFFLVFPIAKEVMVND